MSATACTSSGARPRAAKAFSPLAFPVSAGSSLAVSLLALSLTPFSGVSLASAVRAAVSWPGAWALASSRGAAAGSEAGAALAASVAQSEAGRAEEAKGFIAKGFLVKKTAPIRRAKTSGITKRACGRTCRKTPGEKRPAAGQTPTFQQRLSFNFCLWPRKRGRKRWPKARPRRKTGRGQKARAALECFQKPHLRCDARGRMQSAPARPA